MSFLHLAFPIIVVNLCLIKYLITILICDGPERRGRPAGHPAFLQHEAATQPEDHGKCAVSACFGILCSLDSLDYRSL